MEEGGSATWVREPRLPTSMPLTVSQSARDGAGRSAGPGVAFRACQLALQAGESLYDLWRFEGAVPPADVHLSENVCVDQPVDCIVSLWETATDHLSGTVGGDDGDADQGP
jgi:hypothetical protein